MPNSATPHRGLMFVLSSPSGAGKSTLARRLLLDEPTMSLSVSATTRAPRPSEQEGREYYFVDRPKFEAMAAAGELLEWAVVFDNFYGTPRAKVEEKLAAGNDVLFDVDWQGARALRAAAPDDVVGVFILPPSTAELERRLKARAEDAPDVISRRMARSADEIGHWKEYDYVIVNYDVEDSLARIRTILGAERLKRSRETWLGPHVDALLAGK
ncbi:guanylate kinase [alpha proteobacterium U9-1i]|nr:guanylate kinase [alpha proteobacterium U9-1i]